MTKPEVIKLLGMLYSAYPNMKEVDEVMVALWFEGLKDMKLEKGLMAVKKHIFESPYPPTIADIRGINLAKKNGFHNFESRTARYTAEELNKKAEEIRKRKSQKYLGRVDKIDS